MTVESGDKANVLEISGLRKKYGSGFELRIDSLSFREGARVALYGRNGSGKSVLLRVLAGVARPNAGTIRWLIRPRVGYATQSGGLYRDLSVRDNIYMRRRLAGLPEAEPIPQTLARRLGLERLLRVRARDLSGGYFRLCRIAAALAMEPDVVLLDEPYSDLDEKAATLVSAVLSEVAERSRLVMIATPLPLSQLRCDQTIQLNAGIVECALR